MTCKGCIHKKVCKYAGEKISLGISVEETEHECIDYKESDAGTTFVNDPFDMLDKAFRKLYPGIEYTAWLQPDIRDDEDGNYVCGLTDFGDDGEITIFVDPLLSVNNAVEIFAHELAHAAVGCEHEHDEKWEEAFDALFQEYNRMGEEMFDSSIEVTPKGSDYRDALKEIDERKDENG